MPKIENISGSMKASDEMDQSRLSESIGSKGKREPKLRKSYVLVLIIVFAAVYSQYLLQYWGVHLGLVLGQIVGSLLVYGVPILAITLLWGTAIIRRFFKKTYSAIKLGLGLYGAFTVLGVLLAYLILFFIVRFDPSASNLLDKPNPVLDVPRDAAWGMVGVSLLVVGPAEEYIFRGFVFGGLLDIFGNRHWLFLTFVSSLLFGVAHLYYAFVYEIASLVLFTDLVTFGMAMAATYYLSGGNLFVPSLIHGAYDATAFLGVATSQDIGDRLRGFMLLVGIAVAVALLIERMARRSNSYGTPQDDAAHS